MTGALAEKKFYEELTDKQQQVVDYLVENPNANTLDVEEDVGCHHTYAGKVADQYDHIVEERRDMENNKHLNERGNVTTVGEIDLTDAAGEQCIQDRPVKNVSHEDDGEDDPEEQVLISVDLTVEQVWDIVTRGLHSEELRRSVFEQAVENK